MNLFTYGTLSVEAVMQRVTGVTFRSEPAHLENHYRALIKNQWFPGMIEQDGASVAGRLHFDIDAASWDALDTFESALYDRKQVRVKTTNGETQPAMAYVLHPDHAHLLCAPWDEEWFRREKLRDYLDLA